MRCLRCGASLAADAFRCAECGEPAPTVAMAPRAPPARSLPSSASKTIVGVARTDLPLEAQRAMRGAGPAPLQGDAPAPPAPGTPEPPRSSAGARHAGASTIVGVAPAPPPSEGYRYAPAPPSSHSGTLLGVSPEDLAVTQQHAPRGLAPAPQVAPQAAPSSRSPTPAPPPSAGASDGAPSPGAGARKPDPASRTLLGVAVPGVAPTFEPDAEGPPSSELGATLGLPARKPAPEPRSPLLARTDHKLRKRVQPPLGGMLGPLPKVEPKRKKKRKSDKRAYWILGAAAALGLAGGLFALLWKGAPPITARVRADEKGAELLEIQCASCPDGTVLDLDGARATVSGHVASIPLAARFPVGETLVKVAIDRPAGRDETVKVPVQVAYRITPDVGTLTGDRPAVTITVEAMKGATVTMGGKELDVSSGRAVELLDVSEDLASGGASLLREVPFLVKTGSGSESGTVRVQLPIASLSVLAPGASIVTDGPSFLLVGSMSRGGALRVGSNAIPVKPDGTFSHSMNVSTVGSATVELRADLPGAAPRLFRIKVRRVANLDEASKEFLVQKGVLGFADAKSKGKDAIGAPITFTGEVMATAEEGPPMALVLKVSGCRGAACDAKVKSGVALKLDRGDVLTVYGKVSQAEPTLSVDADFVRKTR